MSWYHFFNYIKITNVTKNILICFDICVIVLVLEQFEMLGNKPQQSNYLQKCWLPIITYIIEQVSIYMISQNLMFSCKNYIFKLNVKSKELCVIVTPFGKCKYLQLLMVLNFVPEFFQHFPEDVLYDVDNINVCSDNIGTFFYTWEQLLLLLDKKFYQLKPMIS